MLAFWSRMAHWLYVDVREKGGKRITFGLPVPLRFAHWGIGVARNYVDEETRMQLNMAQEMLSAVESDMNQPTSQPVFIEVDDEDGDRVVIYMG